MGSHIEGVPDWSFYAFLSGLGIFVFTLIWSLIAFLCRKCRNKNQEDRSDNVEIGLENIGAGATPRNNELTDTAESSLLLESEVRNHVRVTKPEVYCTKNGWFLYKQNYDEIYGKLLVSGELFTDPEFPPDDFSISYDGKGVHGVSGWIRAKDLYANPAMVKKGHHKTDVNQGRLGDCWFLSAMAALSEKKRLFKVVVPPGQSFDDESYRGIFRFQFWRYGQWVEVVVDDFIPVDKEGRPVFNHSSNKGEMWPVLLEKAYSKLQGSYKHLQGGRTMSSMVDLSGGFPEGFQGDNGRALNTLNENLFFCLRRVLSRESDTLVCAGTLCTDQKLPNGLIARHAYTIFGVYENKDLGIPRLVKLRNPHGRGEWTGAWSPSWLERCGRTREAELLQCVPGEFYLPYDVFVKNFFSMTICYSLGPSFTECHETGLWTRRKHRVEFTLSLTKDAEVFVSFSQTGRRQMRDEKESLRTLLPIRLCVLLQHEYDDLELFRETYQELRTVTFHKQKLDKGKYRLVGEVEKLDDMTQAVFLRVASNDPGFKLTRNS